MATKLQDGNIPCLAATPSEPRPTVLVFDSGVGGLSVYDEIRHLLPDLHYIYAFDNVAFPYGEKSEVFIVERVVEIVTAVQERYPLALAVVACNTASTVSLPALREKFDFPVVGVVPAIKPAARLTANGIVQGMRPLIGYNYGAGERQRVSQIFKIVLCMSGIIMVFGTVICLLIPGQLMGLFTHTEATIQAGETALRIIGAGFIVSAVSVTSSGALEGLGKGTPSLLISLCRYVVVIIPTAFLLSSIFGAVGVWNAFWITEAITAIISICVYYKAISQSQRSQSTVK